MGKSLKLPPNPPGQRPPTRSLLKGILDYDQFDDWWPDPLYCEDRRVDETHTLEAIDNLWTAGELPSIRPVAFDLPRDGGKVVPAVALPLNTRVCFHGVVGALAGRINQMVQRDQVYGFEYFSNQVPLFSKPGDGLGTAYTNAMKAALLKNDHLADDDHYFDILDVATFGQAARRQRLWSTLETGGVRKDETAFLEDCLGSPATGLPSFDDAAAFLYNAYLQPADARLARDKVRFFRYRDEYFVIDKSAPPAVRAALGDLQLAVRDNPDPSSGQRAGAAAYDSLRGIIPRKAGWTEPEEVASDADIVFLAKAKCPTMDDGQECTDRFEVVYDLAFKEKQAPHPMALLIKQPSSKVLDAVEITPLLRRIHEARRFLGVHAPPFNSIPSASRVQALEAKTARVWLTEALRTGVAEGSTWQVMWSARLLSDAGALSDKEAEALCDAVTHSHLGAPAKAEARLALARSSKIPPQRFWSDERQDAGTHLNRTSVLAANFLARRGYRRPWSALAAGESAERSLVRFLEPHLKGV